MSTSKEFLLSDLSNLESSRELVCPCGCGRPMQLANFNGMWMIGRFDCMQSVVTHDTDAADLLQALVDNPIPTVAQLESIHSEFAHK